MYLLASYICLISDETVYCYSNYMYHKQLNCFKNVKYHEVTYYQGYCEMFREPQKYVP